MPKRKTKTVAEQEKEHAEDVAEIKKKRQPKAESVDDNSLEDKDYLKDYILNCMKEAEGATDTLRKQQRELWDIYQNKQDYSKKEEWQSKLFIPKLFMVVERASMLIKRAILQVSKLFNLEHDDDEIAPINANLRNLRKQIRQNYEEYEAVSKTPPLMDLSQEQIGAFEETKRRSLSAIQTTINDLQKQLKTTQRKLEEQNDELAETERRFKNLVKITNFVNTYSEMIKAAILLGFGCIKRVWDPIDNTIEFVNVDVLNLYIAPDYKPFQKRPPKYLIERSEIDLSELIEWAESINQQRKDAEKEEIFDLDEVGKIEGDYRNPDEEAKTRQRLGLSSCSYTSDKKVELLPFWGKVVSRNGKVSKKDQFMILANRQYLISRQDNPHRDKRIPYNFTVPVVYPHRGVAGVSLVGAEARMQLTLNNIINMALDNLNYSINKMFEYNPHDLEDPKSLVTFYPGKTFKVNTDAQKQAIREVRVSALGQDVFKTYEIVSLEMQEGTAVTEFVMAMPGKKAKTLGEVEIKTGESHGYFDVIARDLEQNSIKEILKDTYSMLVQFSDFADKKYQFNVGGLSLLLLRKEQIQQLREALILGMRSPQLAQRTKIQELWKRLLDIWNVGDVYIDDEEFESKMGQMQPSAVPGMQPGVMPSGVPALPPGVSQAVQQRAAEDAHKAVASMSPQQLVGLST